MEMNEIAMLIANIGLMPVIIAFFIWSFYQSRKADNETRQHNQQLVEKQQEENRQHDEKIMQLVMQLSGSVNQVKEQTAVVHTKDEEEANTKLNLTINNWLNKLLADTKGSHAMFVAFHNGGRDNVGRYLQKMSITHESVDGYTVPIMAELQNFPRNYLPHTIADLESAGNRYVNDIETIKDFDPNTYCLCSPRGVKSFMAQAVQTADKKTLGFIALEFKAQTDCQEDKTVQRKLRDIALKIGGILEVTETK